MTNSRGSITIDFLFAFVLIAGFSLIILTFSATLSMVEVVQYVAFASARNYFSGNYNEPSQKKMAENKFNQLKSELSPLLGGWFDVSMQGVGNFGPGNYAGVSKPSPYRYTTEVEHNIFQGVMVNFTAKILDFQIPFFGATQSQSPGHTPTSGFTTNITSFLGREPSFEECTEFNNKRWENIKNLNPSYGKADQHAHGKYIPINDNGC